MRQGLRIAVAALVLAPAAALAQVSGKSTGQCYYGDERGWVQCGDYPAGNSSSTAPSGPTAADPRQQQMVDMAGQLGAAIGAAIGRQLSGEADRDKAQGLNNQAIEAANRGEWHTARALTLQALRLVPDDATLKQNLAFCDREIAEAERVTAAHRADQERARREAEEQAAAGRREEIAQNLRGQFKMEGDSSSGGVPLGLKMGESEPVAVASAARPANDNSLGLKLSDEEKAELRDARIDAPNKDRTLLTGSLRRASDPAPNVRQGELLPNDDGYLYLPFSNTSGKTVSVAMCTLRSNGTTTGSVTDPLPHGQTGTLQFEFKNPGSNPVVRYRVALGTNSEQLCRQLEARR